MFERFFQLAAALVLVCVVIVIIAVIFHIAGLADDSPPAEEATLPEPEYIDADIILMERGVAPEVNRTGLAQPEAPEEPQAEPRYAPITAEERELIARIVYLESNNQPFAGQQAVAEVILNRRAAGNFQDTIAEIIYADNPVQFTTAAGVPYCTPTDENYAAVDAAMSGEPVFESYDVVYFNDIPENTYIAAKIGDHYFCYQYPWARTEA